MLQNTSLRSFPFSSVLSVYSACPERSRRVVKSPLFSPSCKLSATTYRPPSAHFLFSIFHFRLKSNISPTYAHATSNFFLSPTYAKTRGCALRFSQTLKFYFQCRRADIFDFSPDFSRFFRLNEIPRAEMWHRHSCLCGVGCQWIECTARSGCATGKRKEGGIKPPLQGKRRGIPGG